MWLAEIVLSQSMFEMFLGLLAVQFIAAIGWAIRMEVRMNSIAGRLDSSEKWQHERMKPIEDYYKRQEELSVRITTLEEQTRTIFKTLERMDGKLDKLVDRDGHREHN